MNEASLKNESLMGSILATTILPQTQTFGLALIAIILFSFIGLMAAILLPPGKNIRSIKGTGAEEDAA